MEIEQEFFEAIRTGDVRKIARMLEVDPALAECRTEDGVTPLLLAAYHGQAEMAAFLVAMGATPTIYEAAATGDLRRVDLVVADDPGAVAGFSEDGWTALHLAAHFGHEDVVEALLAMGADIEAVSRNTTEATPLISAIAGGHVECAQVLLDHGADVGAREAGGWTTLHVAAQNSDVLLAGILVGFGADPNAAADGGTTPIDLAASRNDGKMLKLLRASL